MKVFCWVGLLGTLGLFAAEQPVTMAGVSRAREALVRAKGVTESERSEISAYYDQAAQSLQQEIRWKAQQFGHMRTKVVLESEMAAARAAAILPQPGPPPPPPSETAQQVEEELARVRNNRASRIKLLDGLSKLRSSLRVRDEQITVRRAEILENLQAIQDEMSVLTLAAASQQWEQANRMALLARGQSLRQELQTLAAGRDAIDLRRQLIPVQREAQLLRLEADEELLSDLRARKSNARERDAKKSLDSTVAQAKALSARFPQLAPLAADIASRATALWGPEGIEAKSDRATVQSERMSAALGRFKEITANTRRRYQNSGVFSPASEWWPPRVEQFGKPAEAGVLALSYSAAEVGARRELFRLEEERNAAPALETQLQQLVAASGMKSGETGMEEFKSQARLALKLKRNVMNEYLADGREYLNILGGASLVAKELLAAMQDLQSFVLQRVLLTRSVPGSTVPSSSDFASALLWFCSISNWSRIVAGLRSAETNLLPWIAGLLATLLLFLFRRRVRQRIEKSDLNPTSPRRIRTLFFNTFLSLLWAAPGPVAIAYAGRMIGQVGGEVDLARAISAGASHAARFLFAMLLIRRILGNGGAVHRLMGWPAEVRELLDWGVKRLMVVFTPLYFVFSALAEEGMFFNSDSHLQSHHNSLGRLCFLAAVFVLLSTGRRVLKPQGAVTNALGARLSEHGVDRARLSRIILKLICWVILLLDRSIRVGDSVTVGNLSGLVARIQMRATTVTLWDHSDMVVPNKEFITTKLVNWTLSNPDTRVDLKVGVDYNSDVEQVREVLMGLAQEHPAVLKDPPPQVLLTEFGESAILFELRVFGLYSYGRPVLLDELHRAVVREFRKLGIVIAFPHLEVDLHPKPPAAQEPHV